MNRAEEYAQLMNRIASLRKHAQTKGDSVLADKARKMQLNVDRLMRNDESNMTQESV